MPQALGVAFLLAGSLALAAPKFTLVIGGRISAEDAVDERGARLVSSKAVLDLARALGDVAVTFDGAAGVVSLTHEAAKVPDALSGFSGSSVAFVVDGKITKVAAKSVGGVPYLAPKELKRIAEALGWSADLDAGAGVLALTRKDGGATTTASAGEGSASNEGQSWGMGGSFVKSISQGSQSAMPAAGSGGNDVCRYLDGMKILWLSTEPSPDEKTTFNNLARLLDKQKKDVQAGKQVKGNPQDLLLLEKTLKGFAEKVHKRAEGTRTSKPPAAAQEWYSVSVDFLDKFEAALDLCFKLIDIYKAPPAKQKGQEKNIQKMLDRLQQLNAEIQGVGAQEVEVVTTVREGNGCAPP